MLKDVCEDTCKLISTFPDQPARHVVRTGYTVSGLVNVLKEAALSVHVSTWPVADATAAL